MTSQDIRKNFISFFKNKEHTLVKSSPLLPENDPTLLFVNAGMNQFKNVFSGLETKPFSKAISIQKCLRAGGKHNDLDNVGFTPRHHTFFEMLGNFSFGDYFKEEAIQWAWQFLTEDMGLSKNRLYITTFNTDQETKKLWMDQEQIAPSRIFEFGEEDNFWRMGDIGPCGPCTEIHYHFGNSLLKTRDDFVKHDHEIMEVWNLVFMQFYEDGNKQSPLKKRSVDTGMGLERLAAITQGERDNFHTDLFMPFIEEIETQTQYRYCKDIDKLKTFEEQQINIAFRVLADHIRAAVFLIHDGIIPTGEGRGYVLRRIIRRALRYAQILSKEQPLFSSLSQKVIDSMKKFYPLLERNKEVIYNFISEEENRFLRTLDKGNFVLEKEIKKIGSEKILSGLLAFQLYDTYGFPLDLTELILKEHKIKVDKKGFDEAMEKARTKAKKSWKGGGLNFNQEYQIKTAQQIKTQYGATDFVGYKTLSTSSPILGLSNLKHDVSSLKKGTKGLIVTKNTPFYAESGGQIGDKGFIETAHGGKAFVFDCQKQNDIHIHFVEVTQGEICLKDSSEKKATLTVDKNIREQIAKNHSATHLLHSALKKILGDTVCQAGSLVSDKKLRFDFTHPKGLTQGEIKSVEDLINEEISKMQPVVTCEMSYQAALDEGALSLAGEKYTKTVRVLTMGDFSKELCGGTHIKNTSEIQMFKIISELSVSAGVRRIEALTGLTALQLLRQVYEQNKMIRQELSLPIRWTEMSTLLPLEEIKNLKKENKKLIKQLKEKKEDQFSVAEIMKEVRELHWDNSTWNYIFTQIKTTDPEVLKQLNDRIRDKMKKAVVILLGEGVSKKESSKKKEIDSQNNKDNKKVKSNEKTYSIVIGVTADAKKHIHAGNLLKKLSKKMKGRGGGRPDFAQGVVEDIGDKNFLTSNLADFL